MFSLNHSGFTHTKLMTDKNTIRAQFKLVHGNKRHIPSVYANETEDVVAHKIKPD